WSLCDSDGHNLLNPGETPMKNAQFLVFLAAVLRAVHKHSVNLRLGIIGASNDHRLGANEAPPAVISVYLGESLSRIIRAIAYGKEAADDSVEPVEIGVSVLPDIPRDLSDRNRTSPFAFTGNKFEFRALGSSQNIATANIVLNAAMACALDDIANMLEAELAKGTPLNAAIQSLLARLFAEHMPIVFDGNGYSEEWLAEAERRGLPNLKDTVAALAHYGDKDVMEVFARHNVLSPREMLSRQEILLESYTHTLSIEGHTALKLGRTRLLPAALGYQARLAEAVASAAALVGDAAEEKAYFLRVRAEVSGLLVALDALEAALAAPSGETALARAAYARDVVLPAMNVCREHADALECLCSAHEWPLPSYAELLWLH
ncbi:MAG TPA: glutamine synthetase type III, partial [Candidatus Bilophila faecipullorum]|nr:glutamine synthetase type III [Candidatus Bilophila faecipullorum]